MAGTATAGTVWLCNVSEDLVQLVCIADPTDLTGDQEAGHAVTAVVRGTSFPLDPRRTYTVDLWSPPSDVELLEQLAQSSICFRSPDCRALLMLPEELSGLPAVATRWTRLAHASILARRAVSRRPS